MIRNARKHITGRPRLPQSSIKLIHNFYETKLPDKKLVSKKTGKSASLLDRPIGKLFDEFKKTNPDISVGAAKFYKHRPRHVRTMKQAKYRGCLCEYCGNITLKLKVINFHLNTVQSHTLMIKDHYELAHKTLCSREGKFN